MSSLVIPFTFINEGERYNVPVGALCRLAASFNYSSSTRRD
jgi:hypothetical protein